MEITCCSYPIIMQFFENAKNGMETLPSPSPQDSDCILESDSSSVRHTEFITEALKFSNSRFVEI